MADRTAPRWRGSDPARGRHSSRAGAALAPGVGPQASLRPDAHATPTILEVATVHPARRPAWRAARACQPSLRGHREVSSRPYAQGLRTRLDGRATIWPSDAGPGIRPLLRGAAAADAHPARAWPLPGRRPPFVPARRADVREVHSIAPHTAAIRGGPGLRAPWLREHRSSRPRGSLIHRGPH